MIVPTASSDRKEEIDHRAPYYSLAFKCGLYSSANFFSNFYRKVNGDRMLLQG
jgi:hypothetical protein